MDRARPRHAAPLTLGIALALGAGAAPGAAPGATAGQPRHDGGITLRQQLHQLMPAKPKARATPASLLTVTSCADDGGAGTLRTLVAAAGEGDTVDLSALTCSTITLTQGAVPVLLDDLTLTGPGADALAIDAANSDRVLVHPGYGTLTVTGLTVRNGATSVSGFHVTGGGCIASGGYLVLDHSHVSNCRAAAEGVYGGGIFAFTVTMYTSVLSGAIALGSNPDTGTAAFGGGIYTTYVTLVDSTVSGNRAAHDLDDGQSSYDTGGGIFTNIGGSIRSSTIDHNYSYGFGGGISSFSGVLNIANSTISGNTARTRSGGGLDVRVFYGQTISNSTITANIAPAGGGVYLRGIPDQFELQSTLIAGNTATAGGAADLGSVSPTTLPGNNNLVFAAGANVTLPIDTLHAAPLLRPLGNNGGPTQTHALMPGSPAIDAGNNFPSLGFDQRGPGFPRVLGGAADIGAFEGVVANRPPVPAPAASTPVLVLLGAAVAWLGIRRGRVRRPPFARIFTYLSPRPGHSSQT